LEIRGQVHILPFSTTINGPKQRNSSVKTLIDSVKSAKMCCDTKYQCGCKTVALTRIN
jgi:hypothetical protein